MTCAQWPIRWPAAFNQGDYEAADVNLAIEAAQEALWARTGRRYGTCTVTESYRVRSSGGCLPTPEHGADGAWRNVLGGRDCCRLRLAQRPVRSVLSVQLDGVTIAASGYALERSYLRRVDACWPSASDCNDAPITVEYVWGIPLSGMGELAMGELAYEYLKAITTGECRLPKNATTVTRQGVTKTLPDPAALAAAKRFGLRLCDDWIDSVNPRRLTGESMVMSPDVARRVR